MSFLGFLRAVSVADREAIVETETLTVLGRDFSVMSEVNEEQKAITFESFFLIFVFSFFLIAFLGFMIARINNRRLPSNGDIEDEQPDEEIGNAAADQAVVLQRNPHDQAHHRRDCIYTLGAQCNFGIGVALVNFILEIPSTVLDQIASDEKPTYVFILMLFSFTSMLLCLVELVYNGRRKQITWSWSRGRIPWFYHPPPSNTPFGTFVEYIGLICAMAQCIVTTINYVFCIQDHAAPIKISVMPSIFAFGVLFSKLMGKPNEADGESRMTSDQDGGNVALNQLILDGESRTLNQDGGDVALNHPILEPAEELHQ